MPYRFEIFRFDPVDDREPYFQRYNCDLPESISVLEALIEIRDRVDNSLSFRYSCRGAVCGSCAMMIDGRPDLACRVKLSTLPTREVLIEPLANLEVQKDLIVDMEPFWEAYRRVQPFLQPVETPPEKEYPVQDAQMARTQPFIDCLLCACCYSACPVAAQDPNYLGPAALAKLHRFIQDPRDARSYEVLREVDSQKGAWGCHTLFRCVESCPRGIRPVDGIEGVRRKLILAKARRLFRARR